MVVGVWTQPDANPRFNYFTFWTHRRLACLTLFVLYPGGSHEAKGKKKKEKQSKKQNQNSVRVECDHNSFGKVLAKGPKFSL